MIDKIRYYILKGKEIVPVDDIFEVENFLRDFNKKIIKKTEIGEVEVSTVFLCIDHSFSHQGTPILFETMIFGGKHDGYQERYSTYDEAKDTLLMMRQSKAMKELVN